MSIKTSMSLLKSATASQSGGSAVVFTTTDLVSDKLVGQIVSENVSARSNLSITLTPPKTNASAPNGFTQQRCQVVLRLPVTPVGGKATWNTARLEFAIDPGSSGTDKQTLIDLIVSCLINSDVSAAIKDAYLA